MRSFADLLSNLRGDQLSAWITAAEQAALLPYSSGPVEGNVNRIKMLKRQMYGRAYFDLLRKRVLPAT